MTVTFAPGQAMASVSVPIRDDNTVEFTEMFNATLTTTESIVNVGDDTGTVSIVDNDGELLPSVLAHGSMERTVCMYVRIYLERNSIRILQLDRRA